jgi:ubiquinone/menaquinone biosynthesis C-methylase UbiE
MNADTYATHMASHPEEFEDYHRVAAKYDERDPEDRKPLNKIAAELAKSNRPTYSAIDLGCGLNQLRSHPSVSKMRWTSVDVHAVDDSVTVADMADLPYEEESLDVAVCSRSLWARNVDDVLLEIFRILKTGGRLLVSESFERWKAATGDGSGIKNTLIDALKRAGFVIEKADGADAADETDDVFQLIVARKP